MAFTDSEKAQIVAKYCNRNWLYYYNTKVDKSIYGKNASDAKQHPTLA